MTTHLVACRSAGDARGVQVSLRSLRRPARRSPARGPRSGPRRASIPQLSRTRSAGTAAAEPSTDWCVIACGTSISDSTPPSDSASENTLVARADPRRVGVPERDHAAEAGPADVVDAWARRAATSRHGACRWRRAPPCAGAACAGRGARGSSRAARAPRRPRSGRSGPLVQRRGRARSARRRPRRSARRGTSWWSARRRRRRAPAAAGGPAWRTCCRRRRARCACGRSTASMSTTLSVGFVGVSTQISFVSVVTAASTASRSRLVDHRVLEAPAVEHLVDEPVGAAVEVVGDARCGRRPPRPR